METQQLLSRQLSATELIELLEPFGARFYGNILSPLMAVTEDSRQVLAGSLFVARRGEHVDGRKYAAGALLAGASALLCHKEATTRIEPRIEVDDLYGAWSTVARALTGNPERNLGLVGITGTNGKTSTAYLLQAALESMQNPTACSGTLGFFVGKECLSESLTTPQPDQLTSLLARAVALNAQYCVMEVSSHALAQGRVAGLSFATVAFSNLTQDHLDYHGSMADYQAAKERLFWEYSADCAVINVDDPIGQGLADRLKAQGQKVIGVSTSGNAAELSVEVTSLSARGFEVKLVLGERSLRAFSSLLGRHNLDNWALSLAILLSLNIELSQAVDSLSGVEGAPGRMERVDGPGNSPVVLVDYAHTPDALSRAIAALRETEAREIRVVFGCGGDRDRSKRALMGVAAAAADQVWVTSDNPRSEDPLSIMAEIALGLSQSTTPYFCEAERRKAIRASLMGANSETVVLIAGKGHEVSQIIGENVLPFDDRQEARLALNEAFSGKVEF